MSFAVLSHCIEFKRGIGLQRLSCTPSAYGDYLPVGHDKGVVSFGGHLAKVYYKPSSGAEEPRMAA